MGSNKGRNLEDTMVKEWCGAKFDYDRCDTATVVAAIRGAQSRTLSDAFAEAFADVTDA
jgi:hypothetical protein